MLYSNCETGLTDWAGWLPSRKAGGQILSSRCAVCGEGQKLAGEDVMGVPDLRVGYREAFPRLAVAPLSFRQLPQ